MKNLLVPMIQALLALALVATVVVAVWACWRNSAEIARCEELVRNVVNEDLRSQKVDPLQAVDFPEASRVFGVPDVLEFSNYLFATDKPMGRHPVGEVDGTFDRSTCVLEVQYKFTVTNGIRYDAHLKRNLSAGPAKSPAMAKAKK